ncbi:MAG TPA: LLM class flavin-dependent oxidoreductase [Acetobacteraceae bacterium]|jgi:alkanesulfonate monooxygenase SsuD/methylene tetrahydromethanopterin reductase-like flavin-dependent oxidoreductase (luciferase family)|nr:LLM class flavin-dependent oxidoreductase [Acetobacteraceae bacterium]
MTLHLAVSLAGSGYHPAAWQVSPLPAKPSAAAIQAMARTAERGRLDAILLGVPVEGAPVSENGRVNTMQLDPLPLLGSLIGVTQQIGVGAAWTVDYTEPYNVARVFATLDHLSYGRTAWIVRMFETDALAPRIGRASGLDDLAAYCARAAEFVDVVKELWDSWEDEAFALDKESGMFVDPERVHPIHHVGRSFSVRGPLNVPRPPQGYPVLVQSDPATVIGRRLAAATADVVLTSSPSLPQAEARYQELHALAEEAGCLAHDLRILANMVFVLGETESVAQRRAAELDALVPQDAATPRFVGTPGQFAALMVTLHEQHICDGFNLLPAVLPHDLDLLVDAVLPLLQRHGAFRSEYAGNTLREHLGLSRPRSQYATGMVERTRP